jgi:hypothetical protein
MKKKLNKIITNHDKALKTIGIKAINKILKTGHITDMQYEKLYDIYEEEMPYGTMKARTGDPFLFIYKKLIELSNGLKK